MRHDYLYDCADEWRTKIMIPVFLFFWMGTFDMVEAEFMCPELKANCACAEVMDWWEEQWSNLTVVNCSHSGLVVVPDLSSLQNKTFHKLLLNNNNITEIRNRDFRDLTVKEIVLRKNPIHKIAAGAFVDQRKVLERLDMDSDKIEIDEGLQFLQGLERLKYLDLGYNNLKNRYKTFPPGLFANLNLSSLKTLTLQALQMSKLEVDTFKGIEHLEQLDLSYNFLPDFPKELLALKNLRGLKLYHNEIMSLKNGTFAGLTKLTKLLVGVNDIAFIHPEAFRDLEDSIEEINLYNNPLSEVPTEAIANLKKLKKLSLVKTGLRDIENGSFVGEYSLQELFLDSNLGLSFTDEGMFHGIEESLEVLYIRELNLSRLPLHVLSRLKNLQHLDATANAIRKIDKHFFNGLQLNNVQLMWNQIKHIDHRAFKHFPNNVILNLHQNSLRDISFILKVKECTFKEVYVTKNRIKCGCDVEKVLNSGRVSWDVVGDCHVDHNVWYSFSDPALVQLFERNCTRTKPTASCYQSTSAVCSVQSFYELESLLLLGLVLIFSITRVL